MLTVVGDPHSKPDNQKNITDLFLIVEKMGNDVVWLGDMLDTKEIIRGKCLNLYFNYFLNSKLHHVILVGNHDYFDPSCTSHSLEPLKVLPNVTIVDEPMDIDGYGFLPFYHNTRDFVKALRTLTKCKTIFCHQGINGFDYGNGYKEQNGVDYELIRGIKPHIISGHFHSYQSDPKITYLGTPFTHAFGETSNTKYLGVLKDDGSLELVETGFPKHTTGTINADAPASKGYTLEQTIQALLEMMTDRKNYNRIIVQGSSENVKQYAKIIKQLEPTYKVVEQPKMSIKRHIDESVDNLVKWDKWAKDVKKLPESLRLLGREILGAVK